MSEYSVDANTESSVIIISKTIFDNIETYMKGLATNNKHKYMFHRWGEKHL